MTGACGFRRSRWRSRESSNGWKRRFWNSRRICRSRRPLCRDPPACAVMVTCPSERLLDQLLEGTLPPEDSQTVRAHFRECLPCQSTLDSKIESPFLRDWTATARRRALDRPDAPLLAALLNDLLAT